MLLLIGKVGEVGMRLIDADDLAAKIMMEVPDFMDGGSSITKAFILAMVKTRSATPTIDAVHVVRCMKCKHNTNSIHNPICELDAYRSGGTDFFCADGERRDDNA